MGIPDADSEMFARAKTHHDRLKMQLNRMSESDDNTVTVNSCPKKGMSLDGTDLTITCHATGTKNAAEQIFTDATVAPITATLKLGFEVRVVVEGSTFIAQLIPLAAEGTIDRLCKDHKLNNYVADLFSSGDYASITFNGFTVPGSNVCSGR